MKSNNISKDFIDIINNYFDEYINEGFITSISGKDGQTLKIFENYCIVNTKNEDVINSKSYMFYLIEEENNKFLNV